MRRWGRSVIAGLVTAVSGAVFALLPFNTRFEEEVGLWWLFTMRGAIEPPAQVVLVAIDGTTGNDLELPKLPRDWPRTIHAQLVDSLVARGAEVIVFDMDFNRTKSAYEDSVFATAIAKANRVVLYEPLVGRKESVETNDGKMVTWVEQKTPPTPQLSAVAKAMGPFPLPKLGRTAYEFWTFKPSTGNAPTTPAIALQLYALHHYDKWLAALKDARVIGLSQLPSDPGEMKRAPQTLGLMDTLRNALTADPSINERVQSTIDQSGDLGVEERHLFKALAAMYSGPEVRNINFYGPPGTIARIPYQTLIRPELQTTTHPPVDLKGAVVFVGYSDPADPEQPDRFYTVFTGDDGVDLSGVEIMATAFGNLLTDRALRPSTLGTSLGLIAFFGFTVGTALFLFPAMIGVAASLAVSALYAVAVQWAFNAADLWYPLATPLVVQLPIAVLIGLMGQYLIERRLERRMSRAIGYYLPANIVKELTEKHLDPSQANKVVYGACLATDMSGFTTIAEKMSPTELAKFMNSYFDEVAKAIKRHSVDITNFTADTIMCAWIGTDSSATARERALLAALDVMRAIESFSKRDDTIHLTARIGLQDGNFYVGHTGGGGHLAYSILGDPANTASRLEGLNKQLGTHILAADSVIADLSPGFLIRPLGSFRFLGKTEATPVSEIVALRSEATPRQIDLCSRFTHALEVLRASQWSEATALFESILDQYEDDGPSRFYYARCQVYAKDATAVADPGVIHLDRK
jgi:adenylate cyclase